MALKVEKIIDGKDENIFNNHLLKINLGIIEIVLSFVVEYAKKLIKNQLLRLRIDFLLNLHYLYIFFNSFIEQ